MLDKGVPIMFEVVFTDSGLADLLYFTKAEQNLIVDSIQEQMREPLSETRNRKPLRPNNISSWELRLGKYRVFYDVELDNKLVEIKAVGWKEHNQLFIRGKEYQL